jgi:alanine racemase
MTEPERWAWAEIDLDAIAHNVEVLRTAVQPAEVWAVVKADGYGHGAVCVAERAIATGAAGLCVALAREGFELRAAGIGAPILVLSEQPLDQLAAMARAGLTPTIYTERSLEALAALDAGLSVHVKIDTGMQRVGATRSDALALIHRAASMAPAVTVAGAYTHLAVADEPDSPATADQLDAFERVLGELAAAGVRPTVVHAANSAAALAVPEARYDLVRAGIAIYGISPGPGVDHLAVDLQPAMSLHARVAFAKRVVAGSHVSYGWRHEFERDTNLVTVPIGYADGVPRRLGTLPDRPGADVLIGGRRCPIVGVVTMDQLMVDVGEVDVAVGDEVVLIGGQGDETVLATEWADRLGTIGYEIVCGIGPRVPRVVRGAS